MENLRKKEELLQQKNNKLKEKLQELQKECRNLRLLLEPENNLPSIRSGYLPS